MTGVSYLRDPHLNGDLIVFVAEDDIWLAPAAGGRAWRVSADEVEVGSPRFSAGGGQVAWTSWRDGTPEVYLAATAGGGSERVSYWSDWQTRVRGWSPDGDLLAVTAHGQPFPHLMWAYSIPVRDGRADFGGQRRLPFGPVSDLAVTPEATALLSGTGHRDPAYWKRYRGGMGGRLWVAEPGAGESRFRRVLAGLAGHFASPMLVRGDAGSRLAFLSDHEGTGNVYSCALDGGDLRRHTDHDGFYARKASTDGGRVVYQCAGELWLLADLDPDTRPVRVEVELGSLAAGRAPRLVTAADHLAGFDCDETALASAVEVRGSVHWLTHRQGPARALSAIGGPVARMPRVIGKTGQVIWIVADGDGDALELAAADGSDLPGGQRRRRLAAGQIGWVGGLAAAPDGRTVAVAAQDGRLLLVDLTSAAVTELASSDDGPMDDLAFSSDSAWLAWSQPGPRPSSRIRLARLADRLITDITEGRFADSDPVFTRDGKYLAFLSKRSFDPVYDSHFFDLSFPFGQRPYLVPLAAATPSPFGPLLEGRPPGEPKDKDKEKEKDAGKPTATADPVAGGEAGGKAGGEAGREADGETSGKAVGEADGKDDEADGKDDKDRVPPVTVELDEIWRRIVQVPVPEARYAALQAVEGGLVWLRVPVAGVLGEGGATLDDDRPRPSLEYFDLKGVKCTELREEADRFAVSGDGTRLVVRDQHQLLVIPANRKAATDDSDDVITVDLKRARYMSEPPALWRAAYQQAAQVMRHEFWVPDLADADWDGALEQYRPLLERIATPGDFADMLQELVGELGTSHTYIAGGCARGERTKHLAALLGADLVPGPDGWRIGQILPGESSDPRARSPLEAPGTGVAPGDLLLAVDGQPVDPRTGPGPLLAGMADEPLELTVAAEPGGPSRRAVVIPLASETRLRYQDWVAGRRRAVTELSGGRAGYLHVPNMVGGGWADYHRDLRGEMTREALIVDLRGNTGGHTSQLVLEKLVRRIVGWDVSPRMRPESYPADAPRGPVVAIADEFSGSDGDIITAAVRSLGLGPVVGARTWGGVVGYDYYHELVDGTHMTVPKYAFWFARFGWGVENYGVDPDHEVLITPDDWAAGEDPQLATAVRLALEGLATRPAATAPGTEGRPSRRRPPLPPRPA